MKANCRGCYKPMEGTPGQEVILVRSFGPGDLGGWFHSRACLETFERGHYKCPRCHEFMPAEVGRRLEVGRRHESDCRVLAAHHAQLLQQRIDAALNGE